jgi:hypothetical protein
VEHCQRLHDCTNLIGSGLTRIVNQVKMVEKETVSWKP